MAVDVLGVDDAVVARVVAGRPQARAVVAPPSRHPALLARLRPDVVHANLAVPWAGPTDLAAALALPRTRVVAVQQLPLRTVAMPLWLRTRTLLRRLDAHVAVGEASARRMEDFYALGRGSVVSVPNCVPDCYRSGHDAATPHSVRGGRPAPDRQPHASTAGPAGAGRPAGGRSPRPAERRQGLRRAAARPGAAARRARGGPRGGRGAGRARGVGPRSRGGRPRRAARLVGRARDRAARVQRVPPAVAVGGLPPVDRRGDARRPAGGRDAGGQRRRAGGRRVHGPAGGARRRRRPGRGVARLRDDPALRERLGDAGRRRALASYTVGHMARAYEKLWAQVVSGRRTPRLRPPAPRP